MPGDVEGPQQPYRHSQLAGSGKDQPGGIEHLEEHHHKESEKAVTKGFGAHPAGNIPLPGQSQTASQQGQKLSPVTVAIAVKLILAADGQNQGKAEKNQTQPGKEDIEKP